MASSIVRALAYNGSQLMRPMTVAAGSMSSRWMSTKKRARPAGGAGEPPVDMDIADEIDALKAIDADATVGNRRGPATAGARKPAPQDSFLDGLSSLEEDEDLLAPIESASSSSSSQPIASRRRQPWKEPLFVARSQLAGGDVGAGAAAAHGNSSSLDGATSARGVAAGFSAPSSTSSSAAASSAKPSPSSIPAAPRPVMPELYANMPRDPVSRILAAAAGRPGGDDDSDLEEEDDVGRPGSVLPTQGTGVDYCVFCYHGTGFLRPDNGALLSKFVTDRGSILPKRFTRCCAKHQRKLAHTIKRARWLNLFTWHAKPHPKLRFTSLTPAPLPGSSSVASGATAATQGGAAAGGEATAAIKVASAL